MKQFWEDVWYELKRSFPRTWYFIRHGRLHPEVRESYWPEYKIVGSPTANGGSFTVSCGGEWIKYSHDLKVLEVSNPYTDWALQWANTE